MKLTIIYKSPSLSPFLYISVLKISQHPKSSQLPMLSPFPPLQPSSPPSLPFPPRPSLVCRASSFLSGVEVTVCVRTSRASKGRSPSGGPAWARVKAGEALSMGVRRPTVNPAGDGSFRPNLERRASWGRSMLVFGCSSGRRRRRLG